MTTQSVSTEAAYLVSEATLAHLSSVAQEIMKTEIQLFEKGKDSIPPLGLLLQWMCCDVQYVKRGRGQVR